MEFNFTCLLFIEANGAGAFKVHLGVKVFKKCFLNCFQHSERTFDHIFKSVTYTPNISRRITCLEAYCSYFD